MQASNTVWAGGEHQTMLALAELRGLQQSTDAGPEFLLNKLRLGQWTADEAFEIIKWGLIGGGMDAAKANKKCVKAFDTTPLSKFKPVALKILADSLYGPSDDPVGGKAAVNSPAPQA